MNPICPNFSMLPWLLVQVSNLTWILNKMIIKVEQKHHFGIISKQQQRLISERLRQDGEKEENLTEIELCDQLVEKCAANPNNRKLLHEVDQFIDSKYSGEAMKL